MLGLDTLKQFFGIEDVYEDEAVDYDEYPSQTEVNPQTFINNSDASDNQAESTKIFVPTNHTTNKKMKSSNVIDMPGLANGNSEVVVIEPSLYEEMPQVIQALRDRKSVVLNLNAMDLEEAQRAVDFIAGGTYAMDGHQERVGEGIFLFTPSSVKVSSLSGILKDVHTPEPHVRRTTPAPDAWGQHNNVAAQ